MWFTAFCGRVYRDATTSPLFHEWMTGVLFKLMNKGARPGYIDEMQIQNLRFGAMPPMLKNVRWVPTSALDDAELQYDIAMAADMSYMVRAAEPLWRGSGLHCAGRALWEGPD